MPFLFGGAMDFLQFLNTLENTLNQITVHGRPNIERMAGIFMAIDKQRSSIMESMQKDGEEDGRQVDRHVGGGIDS